MYRISQLVDVDEVREILKLALPAIGTNLLTQLMPITDQIMVGRLGKDELAAAALSNTYFMFYFLVVYGMMMALDTLAAQAFGAKRYHDVDNWTVRSLVIMTLVCIPVMIGLGFSEEMMLIFQQDKETSRLVGKFCVLLIPGVLPLCWFSLLQKYLQAQSIMMPSVVIAFVCNIFNAVGNYVLIYYLDWGLSGAPVATSISRFFMFLFVLAYVIYHRRTIDVRPFNVTWADVIDVDKLKLFGILSVWGGISLAFEGWTFEITTLIAGTLGTKQLDGHAIMLSISAFTFLAGPFGIACAASIRVGNLIGAGQNAQGRKAAKICMAFGVMFMTVTAIVIISSRDYIGMIFVHNKGVIAMVAKIAPVSAMFQFVDGFQGVSSGIQRGLGRQKTVVLINLLGFWIIGLPLGYVICFEAKVGIVGIWWGLFIGLAFVALFHFISLLILTDWMALVPHDEAVYEHVSEETVREKADEETPLLLSK